MTATFQLADMADLAWHLEFLDDRVLAECEQSVTMIEDVARLVGAAVESNIIAEFDASRLGRAASEIITSVAQATGEVRHPHQARARALAYSVAVDTTGDES